MPRAALTALTPETRALAKRGRFALGFSGHGNGDPDSAIIPCMKGAIR